MPSAAVFSGGRPFGGEAWTQRMAEKLGLDTSLRLDDVSLELLESPKLGACLPWWKTFHPAARG